MKRTNKISIILLCLMLIITLFNMTNINAASNIVCNLDLNHIHVGNSTDGGNCYQTPITHKHKDGDGNLATSNTIYRSSAPGGCYVAAGHTHDAVGACAKCHTEPVKEYAPNHMLWGVPSGLIEVPGNYRKFYCYVCQYYGRTPAVITTNKDVFSAQKLQDYDRWNIWTNLDHYVCGSPTNTWKIGCGIAEGHVDGYENTCGLSGVMANIIVTKDGNSLIASATNVNEKCSILSYSWSGAGTSDNSTVSLTKPGEYILTVTWSDNGITRTGTTSYTATEADITAKYIINHYKQNVDGTYPSNATETQEETGFIGSEVTPLTKSYTGFTSPSSQTVTIKSDGSTIINYYYTRNSYPVTYIDTVETEDGDELGRQVIDRKYEAAVRGADVGSSGADNAYHNGYYYVSDTTGTVSTSGAVVYRFFKLRTLNITGTVEWIDNSNKYGTRPSEVTVYLYRNGALIDQQTGLTGSNENEYGFYDLPKYDADGNAYTYTVSQSKPESGHAPEDKYVVTQNSFNFINKLLNTNVIEADDPDPDGDGLVVRGAVYWEDAGNRLGYRPDSVSITLWQTDESGEAVEYDTADVTFSDGNTYSFTRLPKYWYDSEGTPWKYEYTVSESFEAVYALPDGTLTDAYEILEDTPLQEGYINFTNRLLPAGPINPVKKYVNNLDVYSNIEEVTHVILKQLEYTINEDYTVSYDNYSGNKFNIDVSNETINLKDIPCGKYEIDIHNTDFVLENIKLTSGEHAYITVENNKYYLVLEDHAGDTEDTLIFTFNKDGDIQYSDKYNTHNYFAVGYIEAALLNLDITAMSNQIIIAEDTITEALIVENILPEDAITENTVTIDYIENEKSICNMQYTFGEVAEILDYEEELEGKEFLGWSKEEHSEVVEYYAGDIIEVEESMILYPVFKNEIQDSELQTQELQISKEIFIIN